MEQSLLEIERLASGGSGVGRLNGKVCFVPFSAPGDRLKVRVSQEHRSWCKAEIEEICEASLLRVKPECPVFGSCGGCDWQHIKYDAQTEAKQQILVDALQRVAHCETPKIKQIIKSEKKYGYRSRAQFKLYPSSTGLHVGFYRRGSHFVIDLTEGCPVVTPAINSAMSRLRNLLKDIPDINRVPQVTIEDGLDGVVAIIHYIGASCNSLQGLLLKNRDMLGFAGLFIQSGRKESLLPVFGNGHLTYLVPDSCNEADNISLGYEIGGFSQINRQQNVALIKMVSEYAAPEAGHRLLDLFCGNGNLSLHLAGLIHELLGIEGFSPSIASAVDNARQHSVNNSTFRCYDVVEYVRQLINRKDRFDTVLLDPPRTGNMELARDLGLLEASRIIYVSCDPATMARDIAIILGSADYRLIEATPLDMFPHTSHLETVSLLKKI